MNRKTVTLLTLTAAALFTFNVTGSVEAAGTEKQVSFLSEQAPVWSTAPFYADWLRGRSSVAVTDLDRNGRLELFFLKENLEPVAGAAQAGSNREQAMCMLNSVPVSRQVKAYEVSADGKRLEELKFAWPDVRVVPDLYYLSAEFLKPDGNIRFYHIKTTERAGTQDYRLYHQVISLKDGTLMVQTVGTEYGKYVMDDSKPYTEAVNGYCETRNGERMNEKEIADYALTYTAGTVPKGIRVYWIPAGNVDSALQTGTLREVLQESWKNFVYEDH